MGKYNQAGKGIEENGLRTKNGTRNKLETISTHTHTYTHTKGGNPGAGQLRKRSGATGAIIANRIRDIEERVSGIEDSTENIGL